MLFPKDFLACSHTDILHGPFGPLCIISVWEQGRKSLENNTLGQDLYNESWNEPYCGKNQTQIHNDINYNNIAHKKGVH